jgi:hypothetical protein
VANDASGIVFRAAILTKLLAAIATAVSGTFQAGIAVLANLNALFTYPTGVAAYFANSAYILADRTQLQAIFAGPTIVTADVANNTDILTDGA